MIEFLASVFLNHTQGLSPWNIYGFLVHLLERPGSSDGRRDSDHVGALMDEVCRDGTDRRRHLLQTAYRNTPCTEFYHTSGTLDNTQLA
jgi:hypothetical protein